MLFPDLYQRIQAGIFKTTQLLGISGLEKTRNIAIHGVRSAMGDVKTIFIEDDYHIIYDEGYGLSVHGFVDACIASSNPRHAIQYQCDSLLLQHLYIRGNVLGAAFFAKRMARIVPKLKDTPKEIAIKIEEYIVGQIIFSICHEFVHVFLNYYNDEDRKQNWIGNIARVFNKDLLKIDDYINKWIDFERTADGAEIKKKILIYKKELQANSYCHEETLCDVLGLIIFAVTYFNEWDMAPEKAIVIGINGLNNLVLMQTLHSFIDHCDSITTTLFNNDDKVNYSSPAFNNSNMLRTMTRRDTCIRAIRNAAILFDLNITTELINSLLAEFDERVFKPVTIEYFKDVESAIADLRSKAGLQERRDSWNEHREEIERLILFMLEHCGNF